MPRFPTSLVIAGFVVSFVMIGGGINTVGVLLNAIAADTHWARSSLSLAVSVGAVVAALATPAVGVAVDRVGVRIPMLVGSTLLALGFALCVAMQAPWQFVAANLFLGAGFAAFAGYERPILHGLCSYGVATKAAVDTVLDDDPASVASISGRFSGVVFPGETIVTRIWDEGAVIWFEASTVERGERANSIGMGWTPFRPGGRARRALIMA